MDFLLIDLGFICISSGYALWQVTCQFVNLTRWKVAICGEYMKSGFKVYEMTTILCFFFFGFNYVLLGFICANHIKYKVLVGYN